MRRLTIVILLLLAGCIYPTPTTPAPIVTETVTPAPYPNPIDYGEIGHNPYPAPVQSASVEGKGALAVEAPTCGTNIEYPSRVYTLPNAPDDVYSETCIWSQLAGSYLVLYDQDGVSTQIGGSYIGVYPPNCRRFHYRLNDNGVWSVQVMVQDPGGVNLCSLSPVVLERWRYIFIELWR